MKRFQIYLTERQHEIISKTAKEKEISTAEYLRRILDQIIDEKELDKNNE